jgi:L-fuculose-phosphate aldolase
MDDNIALKKDLIHVYRWLRRYGYNDSHSGNVSARRDHRFWVTPTGACADTLKKRDLIACGVEGALPVGASLDAPLHQAVYAASPGIAAVLHSHCPHAVALTLGGDDYLPPDFEGQYYLPRVPVITVDYAEYVEKAPALVARALVDSRVVIVRGHGVYARGATINEAYKWTCSLELSAQTAWLARTAGIPLSVPQ